jgi:toxin ParE1/3/4
VAKPIEFHAEASAELEAAFDWYFVRNQRVASDFLEEVDRAIQKITESPNRWALTAGHTHRYLLHRFPFAVVYRELPSVIQILAVAHGRRRAGYWKGRT